MNPGAENVPKIYTSRYKKSEKVLKGCFIVLYIVLAIWLLKTIVLDSMTIGTNAYNPRLSALESRYIRGSILDRDEQYMAQQVQNEDGSYSRMYPYGSALGLVTGYSSQSKSGLELEMNSYLLSAGSVEDLFNYWILDQTIPGCDVVTTIDADISQYAYERLGNYNGAVIITEADSGKVLALVSKPAYDPNDVIANWDSYAEDENNPFFNRATQGQYPPGSTFKIITSLAWYRSVEYDPDFIYTCNGVEYFNGNSLPCFGGNVHGTIGLSDAFAYSCNTFFGTLGNMIGAQQMMRTMDSLGFGNKIDFQLPTSISEYGLDLSSDAEELAATAIGQGKTVVTPLFMNQITATIANEGKVYDAYLVDRVVNAEGEIKKQFLPDSPSQLMTAEEASFLKELMAGVTSYGTASNLSGVGVPVYGKTGTAENATGVDHSWFTGFAEPEEGSPIVITVLVEQAGGQVYASSIAADILWTLLNS